MAPCFGALLLILASLLRNLLTKSIHMSDVRSMLTMVLKYLSSFMLMVSIIISYSLIKGGINNLTRQMASYYGKFNIRINSLCPGGIEASNHNSKFIKNYKLRVPLKRLCKESDVASAVLFLSSDASSYITGTNIMVDGGWTAV